jgi:hypothetical protein
MRGHRIGDWPLIHEHQVIDHAIEYVRDTVVHTNGVENFWSLMKRTIKGTYVSVEPFHLGRYLDEQTFRFNERDDDDAGRFRKVLSSVFGRRPSHAPARARAWRRVSATP